MREYGAEIDVARFVVRRIGVGHIGGQNAYPLPVQQQRLFMNAKNVIEHVGESPRGRPKQEPCQPNRGAESGLRAPGGLYSTPWRGSRGARRQCLAGAARAPAIATARR